MQLTLDKPRRAWYNLTIEKTVIAQWAERKKDMVTRLKFANTGISVEGEPHILENLVRVIREAEHAGIEASNPISDLIFSIEVGMQLNGMGPDVDDEEG